MTGRTIPVTRTDDSEVAGEATQELIKAKTDNLDIALSALRDAMRGSGSKTNTDIVTELASIGGASAAAAGDTGASTTNGFLRWMRDFWFALKGTKTAANSVSVTGASDGVFYVGGVSADGVAPTNQAVRVSGVDGGGLKRTFLTRNDGALTTTLGDITSSSVVTLADTSTENIVLVSKNQNIGSFTYSASSGASITIVLYAIVNGIERSIAFCAPDNTSLPSNSINLGSLSNNMFVFDIPVGATSVKLRASSVVSGTVDTIINIGYGGTIMPTNLRSSVGLAAGTARAGSIQRVTTWTRESTTPVNANQSITGANKTTFNTASGTALNTATSYGDRFCAYGGSDVAGTLIIEASPDTGTTWYPVTSVALAQVGASGNFGAYLDAPIVEATMRGRLLNGATNQARAVLLTKMIG